MEFQNQKGSQRLPLSPGLAGSPTWDPNYHPYPFTLPAIDSPSTCYSLSGGRWMDRACAIKPKNDCFRAVFAEMKKIEWL